MNNNINKRSSTSPGKKIITRTNIISNNKFKNLLISNINNITNNISNIFSNNEQDSNNSNNIKYKKNSLLKGKINEYCYKNKILANSLNNEDTYSKGRISTNYNNDLELNISDIKLNKSKKEQKNSVEKLNIESENNINKAKRLKYNDSYYKISENNDSKIKEETKSENFNAFTSNNNNEEIKEILNLNIDAEKENLNDTAYKIYEVNSIFPQNENINLNNNNKNEINDYIAAKMWLENENGKNQKINLDDYINKAKEKMNKIRNSNIDEKNILNKKKIKSTFNYILNNNDKKENFKNNNKDFDFGNINNNHDMNNKNDIINNNINNKYIIKKSNRIQNLINKKEINTNKINLKNYNNKYNDNIPDIKSIAEEKIEVFDKNEFNAIMRRNLSSNKIKTKMSLNSDFFKGSSNIKNRNTNIYYDGSVGNKTINEEYILPPNNLKLKNIFNNNIMKTILKSNVKF